MPDRWFEAAEATAEGIFVPGRGHPTADLLLGPPEAVVSKDELTLRLPWDEPGTPVDDRWSVSEVQGVVGVGLGAHRGPESDAIRKRTTSVIQRINRFVWIAHGLIPLHHSVVRVGSAESSTVTALVELLHLRPALRKMLNDQDRTARLIRDIGQRPQYGVARGGGLLNATVEILVAMRSLHYVHELRGRPLPGDVLPEREEAIDAVERVLRANPQAADASRDRVRIGDVLDKHYLGVEPWPFEALF